MNILKLLYYLLKHGKMPGTSEWILYEVNKPANLVLAYTSPSSYTKTTNEAVAQIFTTAQADGIVTAVGGVLGKRPKP